MKYILFIILILLPLNSFAKKEENHHKWRKEVSRCIEKFNKVNDKEKLECLRKAVIVIDAFAQEAYYNTIDLNNGLIALEKDLGL